MLYLKNYNSILLLAMQFKFYMCTENQKIDSSDTILTDNRGKSQENGLKDLINKNTTAETGDVNNINTDDGSCKDSGTHAAGKENENSDLNQKENLFKSKFYELFNRVSGRVVFQPKDLDEIVDVQECVHYSRLISQEKKGHIVDTKLFEQFSEISEMAYRFFYSISKQKGQEFKDEVNNISYRTLSDSTPFKKQTSDKNSIYKSVNAKEELDKIVLKVKFCICISRCLRRSQVHFQFKALNAAIDKTREKRVKNDSKKMVRRDPKVNKVFW